MKLNHDIVYNISDQDEAEDHRFGITKVCDWLFLGGEEDVCQILNEIDVWIDFRHFGEWNRKIFLPESVIYIRMPFKDGDIKKAREILPQAKKLIEGFKFDGKKVLISCHAGVSRSAILALWVLAEELVNYEKAWIQLIGARPHIEPHENFMELLIEIQKSVEG